MRESRTYTQLASNNSAQQTLSQASVNFVASQLKNVKEKFQFLVKIKQVDISSLRKTLAQTILTKQQELIEYFNANQQKLGLTKA